MHYIENNHTSLQYVVRSTNQTMTQNICCHTSLYIPTECGDPFGFIASLLLALRNGAAFCRVSAALAEESLSLSSLLSTRGPRCDTIYLHSLSILIHKLSTLPNASHFSFSTTSIFCTPFFLFFGIATRILFSGFLPFLSCHHILFAKTGFESDGATRQCAT